MTLAISFINALLLLVGIPVVMAIMISLLISVQKSRYNERMCFFEAAIKNFTVNRNNYEVLVKEYLEILDNNCDRKRTQRAFNEFQYRFRDIIKEVA